MDRLIAERDRLLAENEQLKTEREAVHRRRQAERLIADAGLPDYAVTERFYSQLLATPDAEARCELIAERRELIDRLRPWPPSSRERFDLDHASPDDTAIINAIRCRSPIAR